MLSLFPELLFLSPFAPLVIRAALGAFLLAEGWSQTARHDVYARIVGWCEILIAAALLAGAWTQAVALLAALALALSLALPRLRAFPKSTIALALAMALTLVVTGPGAFAFDLPL